MTTATRSIHIDVAPDTVFDRIVDPTIVPPGMTMQTVNESTEGVGNVYEWTYRLVGIPFRGITVYTQYVRNRRFACKNLSMVAAGLDGQRAASTTVPTACAHAPPRWALFALAVARTLVCVDPRPLTRRDRDDVTVRARRRRLHATRHSTVGSHDAAAAP